MERKAFEYVFGSRGITFYRPAFCDADPDRIGDLPEGRLDFSDAANALMALPNLICLIALTPVIVKETRRYLWSGGLDEFDSRDILPADSLLPSPPKDGE